MLEHKSQKNNYFEYRNISEKNYQNTQLPLWIKNEITDKDVKILDYGCGFGQTLKALKKDGYQAIYGVDIEENAIESCKNNNLKVERLDLTNIKNPYEFKFDIIILSHIIEHIPKSEIIDTLAFIRSEFLSNTKFISCSISSSPMYS